VIALLLLLCLAQAREIRFDDGVFRVSGWNKGWKFSVFVDGAPAGSPALLGSESVAHGELIFRPRFPLQPGVKYRAEVSTGATLLVELQRPAADHSPRIEAVYPSASVLPENLLKFYIHFSHAMSRGEAYQRIHLLDETGKAVDLPFLEIDEELWDREGKRLTLLFDPGRVKRGLLPQREVGAALEAGRSYTLVIDRGWPDATAIPAVDGHRKTFRAAPAVRAAIDPKDWRIRAPAAGTRDPLTVEFPAPLDRALLERVLSVEHVQGGILIDSGETRWRFTPRDPWKAGSYALLAGGVLEDLAGNRIGRPFDVDIFERVERQIVSGSIRVPFQVAPAGPSR
jgi:hypothetical protein